MNSTLTPRKIKNELNRNLKQIEKEKNQMHVKELRINIEWHKSRMWGWNPSAEVWVTYHNGTSDYSDGFSCSGCGYDKESTVIAEIFNKYLKYKLYEKHELKSFINREETNHPYGVYYYNGNQGETRDSGYICKPSYNGGVGTSCYYKIAEFIGGKFENIANGKSFGCFIYKDN